MLSVIDENRASDVVTFAVLNPSSTLLRDDLSYYTESVSIFSTNAVFAKLIRKCKARHQRHLQLPCMTVAAFTFIRDGFHGRYSGLNLHNVIEIYTASKYYKLAHITYQCTQFLSNIHDIDDYFIIHKVLANYPKSLFDSILSDIIVSISNLSRSISDLLNDQRLITASSLFQIQSICELMLSRNLICHQLCYSVCSKWCRFHFESSIQPLLSLLSDTAPNGEMSDDTDTGSMDTV